MAKRYFRTCPELALQQRLRLRFSFLTSHCIRTSYRVQPTSSHARIFDIEHPACIGNRDPYAPIKYFITRRKDYSSHYLTSCGSQPPDSLSRFADRQGSTFTSNTLTFPRFPPPLPLPTVKGQKYGSPPDGSDGLLRKV